MKFPRALPRSRPQRRTFVSSPRGRNRSEFRRAESFPGAESSMRNGMSSRGIRGLPTRAEKFRKFLRGGNIIEASANNASGGVDTSVRAKTENSQVKSRGFSFRRRRSESDANFQAPECARCIFKSICVRRAMRKRSAAADDVERFSYDTENGVSGSRKTDARVPQTKLGHRSQREKSRSKDRNVQGML